MTSKSKNNKIIFTSILKFKIIEKTKKISKKSVKQFLILKILLFSLFSSGL